MLYKNILRPIFFLIDPEDIHNLMISFGKFLGRFSLTRSLINLAYGYKGADISKTVDGITYKNPFVLSAGFDYNANLMNILPYVSFSGEEIGSITAKPCSGNPRPRMSRLVKSKSIIVNKGLQNEGVERTIEKLKKYKKTDYVIGISIAKTNCADNVDIQSGIEDYVYSFRRLNEENIGDYYTINISCPNAFGGEDFASPELLEKLLSALDSISCQKPVYIKMPINLSWDKFEELLKIIDSHDLEGVVIGNLNKDYRSLTYQEEAPKEYKGGLSGKACRDLSTELIRKTRKTYGSRFTIIGSGGVDSPESAKEKFEAGADLIQLITGMIYEGPGLVKQLCKAIEKDRK